MSALDECVFITLTKRFTVSGYGYGLVQEISTCVSACMVHVFW